MESVFFDQRRPDNATKVCALTSGAPIHDRNNDARIMTLKQPQKNIQYSCLPPHQFQICHEIPVVHHQEKEPDAAAWCLHSIALIVARTQKAVIFFYSPHSFPTLPEIPC